MQNMVSSSTRKTPIWFRLFFQTRDQTIFFLGKRLYTADRPSLRPAAPRTLAHVTKLTTRNTTRGSLIPLSRTPACTSSLSTRRNSSLSLFSFSLAYKRSPVAVAMSPGSDADARDDALDRCDGGDIFLLEPTIDGAATMRQKCWNQPSKELQSGAPATLELAIAGAATGRGRAVNGCRQCWNQPLELLEPALTELQTRRRHAGTCSTAATGWKRPSAELQPGSSMA